MTKKTFSGGLNSLLGEADKPKAKKAPLSQRKVKKTSELGLQEGLTRATFILSEDVLEKLKALAYWERLKIKEAHEEAINEYLAKYEKKHGKIKPIPKRK